MLAAEQPVLRLADVERMIPPPPGFTDPQTSRDVMSFRRSIYARRVDKVNDRMDDFRDVWPKGRPIDYFIALESCHDNIGSALSKLMSKRYRRAVRIESHQRGIGREHVSRVVLDHSAFFDAEKEDDAPWEPDEILQFKELYARIGPDFPRIAWEIKGRNARQCRVIYEHLSENGELPQLERTAAEEEFVRQFMLSLKFEHAGSVFEVGGSDVLLRECKERNPFPGMTDRITGEVIEFPAMSPDGYVLDYFTWIKLLEKNAVNPFTDAPIYSKDDLVLLTTDNIEQYRDMIVTDVPDDGYYDEEEAEYGE